MRFDLDFEDRSIIHFLASNGLLTEKESVIYTLIFTRPIGRNKANLANLLILYRYPELTNTDDINQAIESIIEKGFLLEVKQGRSIRIECQDPLDTINSLSQEVRDSPECENVIKILHKKQQVLQEYLIEIIGWANSAYASDTYIQALGSASHTIKLPVFSATTHGRAKEAIQQAVERGVHVRLLMYSPELALKTHGIGRDEEVRENAKAWVDLAKKLSSSLGKLEVRYISDVQHSYIAGALLVDDELFRYDIYYNKFQRGHEGFIVQGRPYQGEASNLYLVLNYYFDRAWESAFRTNPIHNLWRKISRAILPVGGIFFIVIGLIILRSDIGGNYDIGLFFVTLGLIPALTGLKSVYRWLSSFEIHRRK